MNIISRGMRNAFRNSIRTLSVVVILGLSVGLALSMLVARQAVQQKIQAVKSSIGNTITVSPAGFQNFQGGGEALTTTQLAKVATLTNVTKLTETLNDRLTSSDTSLVSPITPGSLGNRQAGNSGIGFMAEQSDRFGGGFTRTFTPPVLITGTNDTTAVNPFGGKTPQFVSGQNIDASQDNNVAILGKGLADKNNLIVGSTFQAYGQTLKVAGIYDTGTTFSNASLIVALTTLERLSAQPGSVTSVTVTVNLIDHVDSAVTSIKQLLGSSADVVSDRATSQQAVQPLESVKTISLFSLVGALVAGSIIILMTMMMIVRERRREIGVMKAIGASNFKTVTQFVSEAVTLTMLGLVVGLIIGVAAASPVTNLLVSNSLSATTTQATPAGLGGGLGRGGGRALRALGGSGVTSLRNVQASVGFSTLGYGVAAALAIAIVGSAVPAFLISKVSPAEVMRSE